MESVYKQRILNADAFLQLAGKKISKEIRNWLESEIKK